MKFSSHNTLQQCSGNIPNWSACNYAIHQLAFSYSAGEDWIGVGPNSWIERVKSITLYTLTGSTGLTGLQQCILLTLTHEVHTQTRLENLQLHRRHLWQFICSSYPGSFEFSSCDDRGSRTDDSTVVFLAEESFHFHPSPAVYTRCFEKWLTVKSWRTWTKEGL